MVIRFLIFDSKSGLVPQLGPGPGPGFAI